MTLYYTSTGESPDTVSYLSAHIAMDVDTSQHSHEAQEAYEYSSGLAEYINKAAAEINAMMVTALALGDDFYPTDVCEEVAAHINATTKGRLIDPITLVRSS